MKKYIDKLQSRPRHQRVFIFWLSIIFSVFLVGTVFIFSVKTNVKLISLDGGISATANSNAETADFPSIKDAMKSFLGSGKDFFNSSKEQMNGIYDSAKDLIKKQSEIEDKKSNEDLKESF